MELDSVLNELRQYQEELEGILGRFTDTRYETIIFRNDQPRLNQIVLELRDFLTDVLGANNNYNARIMNDYNSGKTNFIGSSSYSSVTKIIGIVKAAITRIERNPDLITNVNKSQNVTPSTEQLTFPDKITLKWLFNHVPYRFWIALIGMLIVAFSLGIAATTKLSIVQEWCGIQVEESPNKD